MTSIVFNCDINEETVEALSELRLLRRDVLYRQLERIDETLNQLVADGSLLSSQKSEYQNQILAEIRSKIKLVEDRIKQPSLLYEDELELYLSLLASDHPVSS